MTPKKKQKMPMAYDERNEYAEKKNPAVMKATAKAKKPKKQSGGTY